MQVMQVEKTGKWYAVFLILVLLYMQRLPEFAVQGRKPE